MARNDKKVKELKKVDGSWLTIPKLTKHLQQTKKLTGDGKEITLIFTHYRVNMGYLPYEMGGNVIEVGLYQGVKFVRLSDQVRQRKQAGRKKGQVATKSPAESRIRKQFVYQ